MTSSIVLELFTAGSSKRKRFSSAVKVVVVVVSVIKEGMMSRIYYSSEDLRPTRVFFSRYLGRESAETKSTSLVRDVGEGAVVVY